MSYTAQPEGFLAWVTAQIRRLAEEPDVDKKWTDEALWPLIVDAWQRILDDVNAVASSPLTVDYTFTVTESRVLLPSNVGQVLQIGRVLTNGGVSDEISPRNFLNTMGPGAVLDGQSIRFEPHWTPNGDSLTVRYIPNGFCPLHRGATDSDDMTTTTMVLDIDPEEGYFDGTPNAYLGAVVRVLGSDEVEAPATYLVWPTQERVITGYDVQTATITVDPAFDLDFSENGGLGQLRYEVIPMFGEIFKSLIAWSVVAELHAANGNKDREEIGRAHV